jgi:hypothetical protein
MLGEVSAGDDDIHALRRTCMNGRTLLRFNALGAYWLARFTDKVTIKYSLAKAAKFLFCDFACVRGSGLGYR